MRTLVRAVVGLAVMLAFTLLAVVTSRSQPQAADRADAKPAGPVAVPASLVGLEIALGVKDGSPPQWEGDVKVSEGRVVDLDVVRGGAATDVSGSHFAAKSKV